MHLNYTLAAGRAKGVGISTLIVRHAADFDTVLQAAAQKLPDGLLTFTDTLTLYTWSKVAEFALAHRLPTMCEFKEMVSAGCLVS